MAPVRVLLVEDDRKLGPLLVRVLESGGYEVALRPTLAEARGTRPEDVDLAVVDRVLPDGDGLELCTHLRRAEFEGPILMLTARGEVRDRVHALDAGVDDYLTKPFAMEELFARIRALLRRGPKLAILDVGPIHIDLGRRNAFLQGKLLLLTDRELDLLTFLARRAGEAITKRELIENVWDAEEIVANVVEVHISRLRDKLGAEAWMVETVRNAGYRLRGERGDEAR